MMEGDRPRIGFIGLGLMGTPIAMKLIEAGFLVTVWARNQEKTAPAITAGARLAQSPRALVKDVDVVVLCVTDTTAVESVVFGHEGIAEGSSKGKTLIDHSSIRPDATREMATRLAEATGMDWLDAPVSGGPPGVANKTLVVMCGGKAPVFESALPIMKTYAGRSTLMGPIGAGQTTKLINQALCAMAFVTVAEMTALAKKAGIDATSIPDALAGGRADSRVLQEYMPRMASGDFVRSGRIDTMVKDLDALADFASDHGAELPCATLAADVHRTLVERGLGPEDPAAIIRYFEEDNMHRETKTPLRD